MGKILVIKGADFSNVAVDHFDPTEMEMILFNTTQDGKYKVNYEVNANLLQFLNLSSNPNADPWKIIWRDITEFRGKRISIGKTQSSPDTGNYGIVFTNGLIDTITDKNLSASSYVIDEVQLVSGHTGNTVDTPLVVNVPMTAVGLYVNVAVESLPEIHIIE